MHKVLLIHELKICPISEHKYHNLTFNFSTRCPFCSVFVHKSRRALPTFKPSTVSSYHLDHITGSLLSVEATERRCDESPLTAHSKDGSAGSFVYHVLFQGVDETCVVPFPMVVIVSGRHLCY